MARLDDSLFAVQPDNPGGLGTPFFQTRRGVRTVGIRRGDKCSYYHLTTGELLEAEPAVPMSRDDESNRRIYIANPEVEQQRALVVEEDGQVIFQRTLEDLGFRRLFWRAMSIAPGGRFAMISNAEQAARIEIDTATVELAEVDAGTTGVAAARIARSGHAAFVAGVAGRAALWLVGTPKLVALSQTFGPARSVAFHPQRDWLAVGLQDTTIGIWDVKTGERQVRADGHQHAVTAVAFSPDGKLLYSGSLDRSLRIWRAPKLAPLSTKHGHARGLDDIRVDPVTGTIASCGEERELRVWSRHQSRDHGELHDHDGFVFPVAYSPDGRLLASAGNDGTVRLWHTGSHSLIATLPSPLGAALELAFNADGSRLLAADQAQVTAWDLDRGRQLTAVNMQDLGGSPRNPTFALDGQTVVLPQYRMTGDVPGWNFVRGEATTHTLRELAKGGARCVSSDGRFAVLTKPEQETGSVSRANSDSGAPLVLVDVPSGERIESPHISGAFAWIPHTSMLAARNADDHSQVLILDAATGELLTTVDGHSDRIYAMTGSPDGSRLCTSGRDGVRLWSVGQAARDAGRLGHRIVELQGHSSFVWSARWRPDGAQIATGSGDGTVHLWGTDTARDAADNRVEFTTADRERLARLRMRLGGPEKIIDWLRSTDDLDTEARSRLRLLLLSEFQW